MSIFSPSAQGLEKCLQFYCTRQPYWDHLDEHIFQRDFNRYWPDLSPQEKQGVLMRSLADLRLVQRMLPDVSTVPASAVFDLLVATRIKRGQGGRSNEGRLLQIAQALLERGANPNHVGEDPLGTGPFSVLELCLSGAGGARSEAMEWVKLLIGAGADPSLKGHPRHGPPLELALRLDDPGPLLLLLESGADSTAATLLEERKSTIRGAFSAWQKSERLKQGLSPGPVASHRWVQRL